MAKNEVGATQNDTADVGRATVSVEEAARILGLGRNSAYEAIRREEIPSIRIGKRILVPRRALEKMLER